MAKLYVSFHYRRPVDPRAVDHVGHAGDWGGAFIESLPAPVDEESLVVIVRAIEAQLDIAGAAIVPIAWQVVG